MSVICPRLLIAAFVLASVTVAVAQHDFSGDVLNCAVLEERPHTQYSNGAFRGHTINYVKDLEELVGFKCNFVPYSDPSNNDEDTSNDNSFPGFDGIINYFEKCKNGNGTCAYDLAASAFAVNERRLNKVDFPIHFDSSPFTAACAHGTPGLQKVDRWFFIKPFEGLLWGFILVTFIVVGVCMFGCVLCLDPRNSTREGERNIIPASILICCGYIFHHPEVGRPTKGYPPLYQRVAGTVALAVSLLWVLTYEAGLSATVFAGTEPAANLVAKMKSCHEVASQFCVVEGDFMDDFWNSSIVPARDADCPPNDTKQARILRETKSEETNLFVLGMDKVANESDDECKFFLASSVTLYNGVSSRYCGKLEFQEEEVVVESPVSIVLPKNSPLTDKISRATLELRLRSSFQTGFDYVDSLGPKCSPFDSKKITFSRMLWIFVIFWSIFVVIAALLLLIRLRQ